MSQMTNNIQHNLLFFRIELYYNVCHNRLHERYYELNSDFIEWFGIIPILWILVLSEVLVRMTFEPYDGICISVIHMGI